MKAVSEKIMTELMTAPEAARMLGVNATTIKRWVDQGRLQCAVTPGGHRRFERREIERFFQGHGGRSDDMTFRFLEHLLQGSDVYGLQSLILEMRAQLGTWWRVADGLGSILTELGCQWERGQCNIFQEHEATQRLQQALWGCVAGLPSPPAGPLCLLAAVEGDRHTLGLSLADICLREANWSSCWLGSPTPTSVLAEAVEHYAPRLVAMSASAHSCDAATLNRHQRTIAKACRQVGASLVLGGDGAWPQKPVVGHRVRTFEEFATLLAQARH
jgi:excisionase family DNA binding protein